MPETVVKFKMKKPTQNDRKQLPMINQLTQVIVFDSMIIVNV
jgi:hypothetical protein